MQELHWNVQFENADSAETLKVSKKKLKDPKANWKTERKLEEVASSVDNESRTYNAPIRAC